MSNTHYKQGDRLPAYTATLQQTVNGVTSAIDLTGLTVRLKMRAKGAASPKVNAVATIVSAGAGTVSYAWGATDLDTVGTYLVEWEITYSGDRTLTVPSAGHDTITVVDDLD